ncbi:MAG: helix-turn-helix domain-containing protein [Cellulomonas sp.]|nr:helix-turn-helix domain-containing protein [Cellulomonas sp.]
MPGGDPDGPNRAERAVIAREIGLRLQRRRIELGYSQEKVAHRAGLSTYTYQKFEHGESKPGTPMNPTLFTLYALADVLELEVGDLVARPSRPGIVLGSHDD